MKHLIACLCFIWAFGAAAIEPLDFRDEAEADRNRALSAELRCLVCQNQNLLDSDAFLAKDLRREVLELMRRGLSDDEIKAYLVERYGTFVLYRPPVKPATWLLWFGPALFVAAGLWLVGRAIRRRQPASGPLPPAADDGMNNDD